MAVVKVSAKSQITLPVEARRAVGIKPLDRVRIEVRNNDIVLRPVADFFQLIGPLGKALPRKEEKIRAMLAAARRSRRKK